MGEYTGELTYSNRKCRRCLFGPSCLICDFVHENIIKPEPVHRFNPKYRRKGNPDSKKDARGESKGFADGLGRGHDLLDDDHDGYKNR